MSNEYQESPSKALAAVSGGSVLRLSNRMAFVGSHCDDDEAAVAASALERLTGKPASITADPALDASGMGEIPLVIKNDRPHVHRPIIAASPLLAGHSPALSSATCSSGGGGGGSSGSSTGGGSVRSTIASSASIVSSQGSSGSSTGHGSHTHGGGGLGRISRMEDAADSGRGSVMGSVRSGGSGGSTTSGSLRGGNGCVGASSSSGGGGSSSGGGHGGSSKSITSGSSGSRFSVHSGGFSHGSSSLAADHQHHRHHGHHHHHHSHHHHHRLRNADVALITSPASGSSSADEAGSSSGSASALVTLEAASDRHSTDSSGGGKGGDSGSGNDTSGGERASSGSDKDLRRSGSSRNDSRNGSSSDRSSGSTPRAYARRKSPVADCSSWDVGAGPRTSSAGGNGSGSASSERPTSDDDSAAVSSSSSTAAEALASQASPEAAAGPVDSSWDLMAGAAAAMRADFIAAGAVASVRTSSFSSSSSSSSPARALTPHKSLPEVVSPPPALSTAAVQHAAPVPLFSTGITPAAAAMQVEGGSARPSRELAGGAPGGVAHARSSLISPAAGSARLSAGLPISAEARKRMLLEAVAERDGRPLLLTVQTEIPAVHAQLPPAVVASPPLATMPSLAAALPGGGSRFASCVTIFFRDVAMLAPGAASPSERDPDVCAANDQLLLHRTRKLLQSGQLEPVAANVASFLLNIAEKYPAERGDPHYWAAQPAAHGQRLQQPTGATALSAGQSPQLQGAGGVDMGPAHHQPLGSVGHRAASPVSFVSSVSNTPMSSASAATAMRWGGQLGSAGAGPTSGRSSRAQPSAAEEDAAMGGDIGSVRSAASTPAAGAVARIAPSKTSDGSDSTTTEELARGFEELGQFYSNHTQPGAQPTQLAASTAAAFAGWVGADIASAGALPSARSAATSNKRSYADYESSAESWLHGQPAVHTGSGAGGAVSRPRSATSVGSAFYGRPVVSSSSSGSVGREEGGRPEAHLQPAAHHASFASALAQHAAAHIPLASPGGTGWAFGGGPAVGARSGAGRGRGAVRGGASTPQTRRGASSGSGSSGRSAGNRSVSSSGSSGMGGHQDQVMGVVGGTGSSNQAASSPPSGGPHSGLVPSAAGAAMDVDSPSAGRPICADSSLLGFGVGGIGVAQLHGYGFPGALSGTSALAALPAGAWSLPPYGPQPAFGQPSLMNSAAEQSAGGLLLAQVAPQPVASLHGSFGIFQRPMLTSQLLMAPTLGSGLPPPLPSPPLPSRVGLGASSVMTPSAASGIGAQPVHGSHGGVRAALRRGPRVGSLDHVEGDIAMLGALPHAGIGRGTALASAVQPQVTSVPAAQPVAGARRPICRSSHVSVQDDGDASMLTGVRRSHSPSPVDTSAPATLLDGLLVQAHQSLAVSRPEPSRTDELDARPTVMPHGSSLAVAGLGDFGAAHSTGIPGAQDLSSWLDCTGPSTAPHPFALGLPGLLGIEERAPSFAMFPFQQASGLAMTHSQQPGLQGLTVDTGSAAAGIAQAAIGSLYMPEHISPVHTEFVPMQQLHVQRPAYTSAHAHYLPPVLEEGKSGTSPPDSSASPDL